MQITLIGIVTIILSFLFFGKSEKLLYLLIFLSAFTASSVVVIHNSDFGIQPSYFVGVIFILVTFIKLAKKKISITNTQKQFLLLIIIFWGINIISLFFPIILSALNVKAFLISPAAPPFSSVSDFHFYVVNAIIYLTFDLMILVSVMFEVDSINKLINALKYILFAGFFSAVWGLFVQFPSVIFGYEYPHWLFNNHMGYGQLWQGVQGRPVGFYFPRISSIAPEPSFYAFFVMVIIAILIVLKIENIYFLPKWFQNLSFFLLMLAGLISGSTTAYFAYVFLFVLLFIYLLSSQKLEYLFRLKVTGQMIRFAKLIGFTFIVLFFAFILIINIFNMQMDSLLNIFRSLTITKMQDSSGCVRFSYFLIGMNNFFDTYFLGSGWASNRTQDMGSTLLADIGLTGFVVFILMVFFISKYSWQTYKKHKDDLPFFSKIIIAVLFAFLVEIFMMFTSVPDFTFLYFWIIWGMLLALPKVQSKLIKERPYSKGT
ncbi:hypothetical protein A2230_00415 [candidate division WOR-1 bacterium RIFOXYA2_FULL_36_21]|uniref:Uncharacterized protein n=1 Tax=candidate division WOR-1 bacterium RIFOXYB2_FULL_36_35 TaxID=1802578 RepID=A0A1F4S5C4_UNCSA|nr:MAG: hypothetical protein A2230_00415 [candidate division WOR-1 bacterium RIFOXYA2_FULL_36_21]OGC15631.1 MAG: hypothetical protein A2290_06115 [candidate division WOR-1 bacterium RIFOXYB2_FULL_36_35]OGC16379.1 MAG: hypothetical protein A2282_00460 [candidate division WOR-1 bacterium RIFOXYA12_FULL_36_13]